MTELIDVAVPVLLAGIVAAGVEGVRRRQHAATVNAAVAAALALLPWLLAAAVRTGDGAAVVFPPSLSLWLAVAGLLHAVGMLGLYETVGWWDHFTHLVSAALLAALLTAAVTVSAPGLTPDGVAVATVVGTLLAGGCWELVELVARDVGRRIDVEPVLVHYGWRDTVLDLVFDLAGALLVVVVDIRPFVPLARRHPEATETLLVGSAGAVAAGSLLMAAFLVLVSEAVGGPGRE
ncbi:MAG: hypothetical protein ABEJ08_04450 [Halobacteriaceae archaeon]